MNLPFRIAKRYFFSKNKKTFISLIANISMLGVGVGAMALVVVMSVFNGLEDLNRQLFKTFDADLKVSPAQGKSFVWTPELAQKLRQVEGVELLTQVIQENALLRYRNAKVVVNLKGVDDSFLKRTRLDSAMIDGKFRLHDGNIPYALLGIGVYYSLSASLEDEFTPIEVWYPRNQKNMNLLSQDAFNRLNILPGGVFAIEQQYDESFAFVPLSFAEELFEMPNRRTSLEIQVRDEAEIPTIQSQLKQLLGDSFLVQNQDEQHASLLRAIKIEKLFVFLTLTLIIAVASFNIFFSLSMLAIEKQNDVKVLYAMGATPSLVKRIFMTEGGIVALLGTAVGLLLGVLLCWLQATFGLVKMGTVSSLVDAYPVKMQTSDFVLTGLAIIIITISASYFPAAKAARQ
ncbi:MAG: FtsX-like permease family protein [Spirosomataceae bacterium]